MCLGRPDVVLPLITFCLFCQYASAQVFGSGGYSTTARVTAVSAMCTVDGITAQLMFDSPFVGKIYSSRYGTTHDCVYYNSFDMNMILFSIPNFKCGTKVVKTPSNAIQTIENEVYVQWEKDAQTAADKRYLFICEGNQFPYGGPGNRNGPSSRPSGFNGGEFAPNVDFSGTISPQQTVIVQSIAPTRVIGNTDTQTRPDVWMQIQDGVGPERPLVQRILNLGDPITMVIGGKKPAGNFDLKVHTCFATDGSGQNKVQIVDERGCSARPTIADNMSVRRESNQILHYSHMKAFKFPGSDDVYFTCSVDTCTDCQFPEPCSTRSARNVLNPYGVNASVSSFNEEHTQVSMSVQIEGKENDPASQDSRSRLSSTNPQGGICFGNLGATFLLSSIALLLIMVVIMSAQILIRKPKTVDEPQNLPKRTLTTSKGEEKSGYLFKGNSVWFSR